MKPFQEFAKTLPPLRNVLGYYGNERAETVIIITESECNSIVEKAKKQSKISTLEEVIFKLKGDGSSTARWIANDFESELNKLKG